MFVAGEGWGECPAIVGDSPEDCIEGGGGGSRSGDGVSFNPPSEWARSLQHLLDDPAGITTFQKFLQSEYGCSDSLEFSFACKGLSKQSPQDLQQLLQLIWKKYVRNRSVPVSQETYAALADRIHNNNLSADMFHSAHLEVLNRMSDTSYEAFLRSAQYIEKLQQRPVECSGPPNYQYDGRDTQEPSMDPGMPYINTSTGLEILTYNKRGQLTTLHEDEVSEAFTPSGGVAPSSIPHLDTQCWGEGPSVMQQGPVRLTKDALAATAFQRALPLPKPRLVYIF